MLHQAVNAAVTACRNDFATNLVPVIINWTKENLDKMVHDFPLPSFDGSNFMNNNTIAPSLAQATGPPLAAAPAHSSPSSVSGALGGPSSLAELDAVTVITCRTNIYIYIYIIFHFCCLSVVLRHRHMCLQAKETPCTILYLIKGQKVDVGKGMIMDPSQPTFHNQPIPAGHFRVSLNSVKSGHEDLPPPVQHVGADDETPPRIGSCKGWVLLWPKNLIRLEPAESTPITTHQQACAETTTPLRNYQLL